jgi:hypothetical protein
MASRRKLSVQPFGDPVVAQVFAAYPDAMREKLMSLRQLVFDTAAQTPGVGELEETLKWGEPAYVTAKSKSGSTVRMDWKPSQPTRYAMYFHCQTNLVETFKTLFPTEFNYVGSRSIVFEQNAEIPLRALRYCIAIALTHHNRKKTGADPNAKC